jgi:DNA-binding IclR family transcriptional regulator
VAQGSAPTARVVRVLETLRGRAGHGLRYAELADEADVSQATCHAILTTLAGAGYVVRDPASRSYTLGPALVGLGEVAVRSFPEVALARAELDALADRTGLGWSAGRVVGDSIAIVAVGDGVPAGDPVRPGASLPFAPPFGAIHVAWSAPVDVDAWVARAPAGTFAEADLRAVVADHRRARVAVAPYTPASAQLRELLGELTTDAVAADVRTRTIELLAAIDRLDLRPADYAGTGSVSVNTITAPVFEAHGSVSFAVALHVADPAIETRRVRALAGELVRTTDRITTATGGIIPQEGDAA